MDGIAKSPDVLSRRQAGRPRPVQPPPLDAEPVRRRGGRAVLILAAIVLVVGIPVLLWGFNDGPPPRLILKYGFPPNGGPTGRKKVIEWIEFREISPGYHHAECRIYDRRGSWLGRLCRPMGLPLGEAPIASPWYTDRWIEFPQSFWISSRPIYKIVTTDTPHEYALDNLWQGLASLSDIEGGSLRFATADEVRYAVWSGLPDDSLGPGGVYADTAEDSARHLVGHRWRGFVGTSDDAREAIAKNRSQGKGDAGLQFERHAVSGGPAIAVWTKRISDLDRYLVWTPPRPR